MFLVVDAVFCIATDFRILATTNSHLSLFFRADGAYSNVAAAALFDLEATIRGNEPVTKRSTNYSISPLIPKYRDLGTSPV